MGERCNIFTWDQAGPRHERKDVLPALIFTCDYMTSVSCCHSCSLWAFLSSLHVPWNSIFVVFLSTACILQLKKNTVQYTVDSSGEEVLGSSRRSGTSWLNFQLRHWILPAVKWSNMVAINSMWIHVHRSGSMCGCSQCPGLLLLFLKNTKHKDIFNIITHCNKQ